MHTSGILQTVESNAARMHVFCCDAGGRVLWEVMHT